jgi:hypothetical protein
MEVLHGYKLRECLTQNKGNFILKLTQSKGNSEAVGVQEITPETPTPSPHLPVPLRRVFGQEEGLLREHLALKKGGFDLADEFPDFVSLADGAYEVKEFFLR